MSLWISNGQTVDSIPVDDRSAQYGDGLFETVAIRGGKPRFWDQHMARLRMGCEKIGIEPPSVAAVRADADAAISALGDTAEFATLKIIVSAGSGPRGYGRRQDTRPTNRVGIFPGQPLPIKHYQEGVEVRICATRLALQPQLAGIKSLNRLEQVLGRSEWDDEAVFEGLMVDTDTRLICGTMSNVFIARQNVLITPAITRCGISGIMRQQIIGWLQDAGVACEVRDLEIEELRTADEVFLSNSQFGILPVSRCREFHWSVGPITRQAMALASDHGVMECAS
jgi:4-amino-4-deoxychorismate lyase